MGVSDSGSHWMQWTQWSQQSHHSHGGSWMDWIWRTARETNVDDAQTNLNSIPEVYCEVSEPNPMGNGVASEEIHGNAVDNTSLASSHSNRHCCTRCTATNP